MEKERKEIQREKEKLAEEKKQRAKLEKERKEIQREKEKLAKEKKQRAKLEKERKKKNSNQVVSKAVADESYSIEGNVEGDIQVSNILKRVSNPDEAQKELNNITKTITQQQSVVK